jgi:hypothetical protein
LRAIALLLLAAACGSRSGLYADGLGADGGGGVSGEGGALGGSAPSGAGGDGGDPVPPPHLVAYAHSADELFAIYQEVDHKLDDDLSIGYLGHVGCPSAITDIARDADGRIYGTSFNDFYRIDPDALTCTVVAFGDDYPNSLAILPAGMLDPMESALVGVRGGQYVRIDKESGAITVLGNLGLGGAWSSSGDLTLYANSLYLTVDSGMCTDCLLRIDEHTGDSIEIVGAIGWPGVFGLAEWDYRLWGFSGPWIISIDPKRATGAEALATQFDFLGATSL